MPSRAISAHFKKMLQIPTLSFSRWVPWRHRLHIADELDVPTEFGILGIYLLASWPDAPPATPPDPKDLPSEIIYVGMSKHIDRRIEKPHAAVLRYVLDCEDNACERLYFSTWRSEWSSWSGRMSADPSAPIKRARLHLYEQALIVRYAQTNGRLPKFNRA